MLATLFLLAVWIDASQPARAPETAFAVLGAYLIFAFGLLVLTWSNWWLDAKLAGPAHAVDIALFLLLILMTAGYANPFFTFFVFLLLSAAIRWGWRATALTAILLTLLYVMSGLLVMGSNTPFELQRFVVRIGYLLILSLILIWFGATQWRGRFYRRDEELLAHPSLAESPIETGLRAAMHSMRASTGLFVWRRHGDGELVGVADRSGNLEEVQVPAAGIAPALATTPFLYHIGSNRALAKDADTNLQEFAVGDLIAPPAASALSLAEGLAIPIRSDDGEGLMLLELSAGLSTDHIVLGEQIAADVTAHIQRHKLLRAAEESAEARSRLTLARDLHDSVVQFLAGAAFRLEAIKRSQASGREIAPELNELKQLMLEEQRELRSFITALRSGSLVAFADFVKDLQALADRLSQQWDVACELAPRPSETMIPIRVHLDAHQLMREAVANAVRHAGAKSITVRLEAAADQLRLEFVNDGADFPARGGRVEMPQSIKERVEQAGGALDLSRGMGVTRVAITLPISGKRQ